MEQDILSQVLAQRQQRTPVQRLARGIGRFGTILATGKPPATDENEDALSKLYAQEAIKKQFSAGDDELSRRNIQSQIDTRKTLADQRGAGYFTYDAEGNAVPIQGPGVTPQMRPAPVGYSDAYQGKAEAQGRLAGTQADFTDKILGGKGVSGSNPFVVADATVGGIHAVNPEVTNQLQQNKQDIASKAPTADQKNSLSSINNVELLLDQLEKDAGSLPSGFGGIAAQGLNFVTRGQSNPNLMVYDDQRKAVAVALYRALTGDTRLSDADAASRALPLLWHPSEAGEVRGLKFQKIKKLLADRKLTISQNFGGVEEGGQEAVNADPLGIL